MSKIKVRIAAFFSVCFLLVCIIKVFSPSMTDIENLHQNGALVDISRVFKGTKFCALKGPTPSDKHNAVYITNLNDKERLGNFFFQVASLIGIAKTNGFIPVLHQSHSYFKYFKLRASEMCNIDVRTVKVHKDLQANIHDRKVNTLSRATHWSLDGYFQSWKYFDKRRTSYVGAAFELKDSYKKMFMIFWNSVQKYGVINISIHIRRGDFTLEHYINLGYVAAPVSYLNRAMTFFKRKYKNVQFIISSNDKRWCKDNFYGRKNVIYSPFQDAILDMEVIKSCDHVIMTSGSFGWWGGWLSGGTVIYYKGFPRPGTWLAASFKQEDYYPPHWIGMD